ncbi:MAG: response regulator [Candidatus Odinarchaeia archaeon]
MKTVLLVDDQKAIRDLFGTILSTSSAHQLTILKAESVQSAFEVLQGNHVDLIVSDLSMPGMDGQQFAKALKSHIEYRKIPFIIATCYTGYNLLYADAVHSKNDSPLKLVELVNTFLSKESVSKRVNLLRFKGFLFFLALQGALMFSSRLTPKADAKIAYKSPKYDKSNEGNQGNIFVNTGDVNKGTVVGEWVDPASIPDIKGETGVQGIQGNVGVQGIQGNVGVQGITGINADMSIVDNNTRSISNNSNRINSLDNRIKDLEKTQVVIEGQIRIIDTKKWEVKLFTAYNTTRNMFDRVGAKIMFKLGKSYEEKEIEKNNIRLAELETKLAQLTAMNNVTNEILEADNLKYIQKNCDVIQKEGTILILPKGSVKVK